MSNITDINEIDKEILDEATERVRKNSAKPMAGLWDDFWMFFKRFF